MEHGVSADALAAEWRARPAALGLDRTAVRALAGRTPTPAHDAHVWQRIVDELLSPDGLTHRDRRSRVATSVAILGAIKPRARDER